MTNWKNSKILQKLRKYFSISEHYEFDFPNKYYAEQLFSELKSTCSTFDTHAVERQIDGIYALVRSGDKKAIKLAKKYSEVLMDNNSSEKERIDLMSKTFITLIKVPEIKNYMTCDFITIDSYYKYNICLYKRTYIENIEKYLKKNKDKRLGCFNKIKYLYDVCCDKTSVDKCKMYKFSNDDGKINKKSIKITKEDVDNTYQLLKSKYVLEKTKFINSEFDKILEVVNDN